MQIKRDLWPLHTIITKFCVRIPKIRVTLNIKSTRELVGPRYDFLCSLFRKSAPQLSVGTWVKI